MQLMGKEKEMRGLGYSGGLMDLMNKHQLDEGAMSMDKETIPKEAIVCVFGNENADVFSSTFCSDWIRAFYERAIHACRQDKTTQSNK